MGYAVIARREYREDKTGLKKNKDARVNRFRNELKRSKEEFREIVVSRGTFWCVKMAPTSYITSHQGHVIFTWGEDL